MNKHNMNYSMTTNISDSVMTVSINKRAGDKWYYAGYEIDIEYDPEFNTEKYNDTEEIKKYYSKNISLKIIIFSAAIIISIFIFIHFNYSQNTGNSQNIQSNSSVQVFAAVTSCDWLNVRSTPSSVNNRNIIEAIRENTKVEILERTNNGWVKIKYNNEKTGYVYSNYLSR